MDVKTTFLHGDLEEEIYMKQPEGLAVKGKKELVRKLKKSLYELKQSPRMWYQKFDTFIQGLGFTRSKADHCLYFKLIGDRVIYLVLYVDDMLVFGNDKETILDLKTQLTSKFDIKYLGAANYILGMEIKRDWEKRKLWLNQRKYVETILQRFNMQDSKSVKVPIHVGVKLSAEQCPKRQEEEEDMSRVPYAGVVDSLMYAMVCTRPDIAHAVGVLNWARDLDQRISTSGYVFNLCGGVVNWMSKKQSVVALSTTEAKYMATTHASKEAFWLQRLHSSMGLVHEAIRIDCDSQSASFLAKNPAYHSKTKHIDVQYHFVRDMI
eukprot:PITA_34415